MSSQASESECGFEAEDLRHFITESRKVIEEDDRNVKIDRGGSLDRLKAALLKNQEEKNGGSAIKFDDAKEKSKEKLTPKPKDEAEKENSSKITWLNLKNKYKVETKPSFQPIQHKKAKPGTAVDDSNRRQTAYNTKNFAGGTVLKVDGAFSKKISLYRDNLSKESLLKKKFTAEDSESDDASVETVKKETTLKKVSPKKKKKQKITMCLYNERSEIGLVRHFLEKGEWKKVFTPEDAVFTFVYNERNLDWGIAKTTMVNLDQ